jgi:dTDP-4-dehydrorhamnose 3,5-epimerase
MKILAVEELLIPEIKVMRFARYRDRRGYFTAHMQRSSIDTHPQTRFLGDVEFVQSNESFSRTGTIRGLHVQWNPYQGKLVRAIHGHLIDLALDIRRGSPTFGKIVGYELIAHEDTAYGEWIWLPPGFAHGVCFFEPTLIEYYCTGEYSPGCEAGISPLADDIDWSLCDVRLKRMFDDVAAGATLLSDKDRDGFTLAGWLSDARSEQFVYGEPRALALADSSWQA